MITEDILSIFLKKTVKLPEGIEFYSVDGQIIFPIIGVQDSPEACKIVNNYIIYLIKRGDYSTGKGFYRFGILLSEILDPYISKFNKCLEEDKAIEFDPNDGNLRTGDNLDEPK